jgi:hypothetical protein
MTNPGWLNGTRILYIAFIMSALSHLPFINLGPRSVHAWRQCNTLAVARNFHQESMDIMNPRVDRRLDTNGVTGMQFPSYEYIVASAYNIVGEHNWVHRLVSLLISFWGALGMYYLSKFLLKHDLAAGFAAFAYTFSPDLYYFGFSALPDILALACSVWGLYYFLKWYTLSISTSAPHSPFTIHHSPFNTHQSTLYFIASLFLITLAGLTKLQFLAIGFFIAPLVVISFNKIENGKKKIGALVLFGLVACFVPLWWYKRSVELIKASGLEDFGITFRPESDVWKGFLTIFQNLTSDLPDLLLNYFSFFLFLLAIYFFFKNKFWKSVWFIPMLVWSIALITYHIIELAQMNVHSYYMMPYYPVLFLMIAYAVKNIYDKKIGYKFLVMVLLLSPIATGFRIIPSRFTKSDPGIPMELYNDATRNQLINATPQNALCIVGPDISGCIYFYHLEKKGFGFNNVTDLTEVIHSETRLENYVRRGARYIFTNDSNINKIKEIQIHFDKINTVGDFQVYKLKR